jgi:hypothetical protein
MHEYLSFRHVVRHSYGFQIKWERMENMVNTIETNWNLVKEDIDKFIQNN